jgi:hypothetical protein
MKYRPNPTVEYLVGFLILAIVVAAVGGGGAAAGVDDA